MIGRSEPIDPRPAPAEDSLPPAREQLPLPRRRQQAHLEPQLREPGSAGTGTPFSAFDSPDPETPAGTDGSCEPGETAESSDAERTARIERPADRAAAFRAATRRGRRPGQRPSRPRS